MNRHHLSGGLKQIQGRLMRLFGRLSGDRRTMLRGGATDMAGRAQSGFGTAKDRLRRLFAKR